MPVLQAPVDLCPHTLALERLKTPTKLWEMRHKEAVSLEGNTSSSHQNKTHGSASMPRCTAAIHHFSKQLGVEMKPTSFQPWKGKYLAEISRKRKAGETSDLSVKSLPRSVRDFCRRGTPHYWLHRKRHYWHVYLLGGVYRIIHAHKHTKIRIRKFILKALQPFIRKFAPSKISRYTVPAVASNAAWSPHPAA